MLNLCDANLSVLHVFKIPNDSCDVTGSYVRVEVPKNPEYVFRYFRNILKHAPDCGDADIGIFNVFQCGVRADTIKIHGTARQTRVKVSSLS